jgi:Mrp family chromosome partitioning ATPase
MLKTSFAHLTVIPPGPTGKKLNDIFNASLFSDLIDTLKKRFDLVLLDAAVINESPDAAILAQFIDAIVLVTDEKPSLEVATHTKELLSFVQAKIIGLVVARKD